MDAGSATPRQRRASVRRVSATVLVVLLSALLGTWWLVSDRWRQSNQRQVAIAADQTSHRLADYIRARLLVLQSLARASEALRLTEDETFRVRARILHDEFQGFQAVNWVGVDGTIRVVTPLEPNRGAVGRNVLDHPVARRAFERARAEGSPELTTGLELFQGGRGFATYFPVDREGLRAGYINGVFRLDTLVHTALRGDLLEGYALHIVDDADTVLREPQLDPAARDGRPQASATVALLDRTWTLTVWPRDGLWSDMRSGQPDAIFVLVILLGCIISWLVHVSLMRQLLHTEAERERRELELRLQRAARMEALGRLAGGVAHDFNNILSAIVGNAELITRGVRLEVSARNILDAADRASELTEQLLSFSRQAPSVVEDLDVNRQLRSLRALLERLIEANITLTSELAEGLPRISCSSAHFGQIVVNLVVNAVDAMPRGGRITLRTLQRDGGVLLEVEDDGEGMTHATRQRIFEPFFTTKPKGQGSGVGLATVFGVVQSRGGTIDVRSEKGVGTVFSIWFPGVATASAPAAVEDAPPAAPPAPPTEPRALLVEDQAPVRESLVLRLEGRGYTVHACADGEEALAWLDAGGLDGLTLIVTDVVMPRLGGVELLAKVRERSPTLPVVLCTGYANRPIDLRDDPRATLLAKPFTGAQLWAAIAAISG